MGTCQERLCLFVGARARKGLCLFVGARAKGKGVCHFMYIWGFNREENSHFFTFFDAVFEKHTPF